MARRDVGRLLLRSARALLGTGVPPCDVAPPLLPSFAGRSAAPFSHSPLSFREPRSFLSSGSSRRSDSPPPLPGPRTGDGGAAVTRRLTACVDSEAVLQLVANCLAGGSALNAIHVAAAFSTLAKHRTDVGGDPRFQALLAHAESLFAVMEARELCSVLYCCGKLRVTPTPAWLESYWAASGGRLAACTSQSLSNLLYTCGQLTIVPPSGWLDCFWATSRSKLAEYKPQELANSLYACGQLSLVLPRALIPLDWLDSYWLESRGKLADFKPQGLSNTLHACVELGLLPPPDWLDSYWTESQDKLASSTPQGLSNTLRACGQLGLMPPSTWLDSFWVASSGQLADFNAQNLSNTLLGCCVLSLLDTPAVPPMWIALQAAVLAPDGMGHDSQPELRLRQLYHISLVSAVLGDGALAISDPALRLRSQRSWRGSSSDSSSSFEASISERLSAIGVAHRRGVWCDKSEHSIDIVIETASGRRIALEVVRNSCVRVARSRQTNERTQDGPFHFLSDKQLNGSTRLRNRMLAACGWTVLSVPFFERDREPLQTPSVQEAFLRNLLASADG